MAQVQPHPEASRQKELADSFRRETTNLQFNKDGTVGLIRLSKPTVDDSTLQNLASFPFVEYLAIVAPNVTDQGFQHVSHLNALKTLFLSETAITSEGLRAIGTLSNLERLSLAGASLDDSAGETLGTLAKLAIISLESTGISDQTISHLAELPQLECLMLDETAITDACVPDLARMTSLRGLTASRCNLSGKGFDLLAGLQSLEHLSLSGCPLYEDGFGAIAALKNLKALELYDVQCTEDQIRELSSQLPDVNIVYSDRPHTERVPVELFGQSNQVAPNQEPTQQILQRLDDEEFVPDFQKHVIPLLGRLGCNGRACHGSFQGKGGFQLSMFGYDFEADLQNLLERIDREQPDESLILYKPTNENDHEGGKRFDLGSWQEDVLRRWIIGGAKGLPQQPPSFVRLEVLPSSIEFQKAGQTEQLRALAVWSDGSYEDVTPLARFETNDDQIAAVNDDGRVEAISSGHTNIIAFYDNGVVATQVIMPISQEVARNYPDVAQPTRIDELVVAKLRKLGVVPSAQCADGEFLRRVSLDMIGTLPPPDEVQRFVADPNPNKRQHLVDTLLEHPAYVTWWTTRLCDLTGANAGYLGNTEMASVVAAQWRNWMQRRVQENIGWDRIVSDLLTSKSRPKPEAYRDYITRLSTYTHKKTPEDFAAIGNPMPYYWFRDNISVPSDKTLSFGYVFMGIRLDCAQCHKHPFDRWSKNDFEQFTEVFTRIKRGLPPDARYYHDRYRDLLGVPRKLNTAALRRQSYLRIAAEGRPIPWQEIFIERASDKPQPARLLGGREIDLSQIDDPTELLARWLKEEPHRYMARAMVNRIWAHYFGMGIVNPTDDLNLANPPSNPELMDYLVDAFVENQYDLKWLHRTIANSGTYQRSWRPNETNRHDRTNFSHSLIRRLPAEVVIDGILQATVCDKKLNAISRDVPPRKINQQPRSYQTRSIDYSLLVFGKSLRSMNCDCERQETPTLPQSLYIRNDEEMMQMLDRSDGWITELRSRKELPDADALIQQAYMRTMSRAPEAFELSASREYLSGQSDPVDGVRDLMWALLNTQEFIANH